MIKIAATGAGAAVCAAAIVSAIVTTTAHATPAATVAPRFVDSATVKVHRIALDPNATFSVRFTPPSGISGTEFSVSSSAGDWSNWTRVGLSRVVTVPPQDDERRMLLIRLRSYQGINTTIVTQAFARVHTSSWVRGDVPRCQLRVSGVNYVTDTSAAVTLSRAPRCARWRVSRDAGQPFGRWQRVGSRQLHVPGLSADSRARVQVRFGSVVQTVVVQLPRTLA